MIRHEVSNSWRIVSWIAASVAKSTEAVASSMMMMDELRRSERAIASSWRWPAEKLDPPLDTGESSRIAPFLVDKPAVAVGASLAALDDDEASALGARPASAVDDAVRLGAAVGVVEPVPSWTRWSASSTSSSVCSCERAVAEVSVSQSGREGGKRSWPGRTLNGSRFALMSPLNSTASCGMMVILDLRPAADREFSRRSLSVEGDGEARTAGLRARSSRCRCRQ